MPNVTTTAQASELIQSLLHCTVAQCTTPSELEVAVLIKNNEGSKSL